MSSSIKLPFYAKFSLILLSLALLIAFLYVGQHILIPVLLSILFAILLRPVVFFFNRKLRFPHVIAVLTAVLLFILLFVSIGFFVVWQVSDLADDWKSIKENLTIHYHHIQQWINQRFNISYLEQRKYIQEATKDSFVPGSELGNTLSSFSDLLINFFLIPIYTFLFLLYRNLFLTFLTKLFGAANEIKLQNILYQVKIAIQSFLVGVLIEMGIVSTLTTVGFMIIGVEYALLLGVITGLLNLIPYIGILVAALLSILATLTSSTDLSVIVGVIIVNVTVQLLDNNLIVPMIVSSKVKINALVSIIAIIIGGAIAGVSGMFLAIPMIAILKVVFDRISLLEPWGFLMGDDLPKTVEWGRIRLPSFDAGNSHHDRAEKADLKGKSKISAEKDAKTE
jgi:predicted PurR-regulated permease PerM